MKIYTKPQLIAELKKIAAKGWIENRRYGNGDVFYDLGFKYINNTEYNYYYFLPNDLELYYNDKFKKYKLKF